MKIVHVETLLSVGAFPESEKWGKIRQHLHDSVASVVWPPGTDLFTIYPEKKANGVKPIKGEMLSELIGVGWKEEEPLSIATLKKPGKLDAVLYVEPAPIAMEWETGNISSSHRALNKMALGLLKGKLIAGTLIVPSRNLYRYLTDRIGNYAELEPYVDLWKSIPIKEGVLEVVVIEHDATSTQVPKIPKGTDGRANG